LIFLKSILPSKKEILVLLVVQIPKPGGREELTEVLIHRKKTTTINCPSGVETYKFFISIYP